MKLGKSQNWKVVGFDEIPLPIWKTKISNKKSIFDNSTLCIRKNTIEKWTKGCILPFLNKGHLGITKNYRGLPFTVIVAKIINTFLLNCIRPEIEKILWKNQNSFRKIEPQHHRFKLAAKSSKDYVQKLQGDSIVHSFIQGIWFHRQRKDRANTTCKRNVIYWPSTKTPIKRCTC